MSEPYLRHSQFLQRCFQISILVVTPAMSFATADTISAGLTACARETDDAKRLACFDALADGTPSDAPAGSAPTATPPLTAEVGLPGPEEADEEPPEVYAAHVSSCKKSAANNRWYFEFDNGQVWRQTNSGRLAFRDCDFDVTLRRDVFGFKIEIPGEDRTIRVTRIR